MSRRLLALALFFVSVAQAQVDTITQRIFLIGDGGELVAEQSHPVIDWLQKNVNWNDERNTAIFLGDNIYPLGLPMKGAPDYERSKHIIDYQLKPFLNKKSRAFYIMGNHDWANGKLEGWQQVRNQYNYINGLGMPNIQALPGEGCPGPIPVELNNQVVVVFVDSQWFLYIHDKPGASSTCNARSVEEFATELREIVAAHPNQLMLVVTHHPLYSFGVHGGDYTWKEHLFPLTAINPKLWIPLPVLGSIYPITRGVFGNLQDVKHPLYQTMVQTIEREMRRHPNAMVASGHDHNLQFIQKDSLFQIVTGAAAKQNRVQENREGELLYHDINNGFSVLEIHKSGKVLVKFYNINAKDLATPNYEKDLRSIIAAPNVESKDTVPNFPDSVLVAANPMLRGSGLKNLFIGKNYRNEWTTPIKVPVLDFKDLKPEKQGGGKQTRSLRVEDKDGKEWSLRSVEKFPDAAIPADLRQTFVRNIIFDGISASYPYSGLSISTFADAAGVPTLRKKLVYIPDDPRLGRFRETFKNTLVTMEERQPGTLTKTDNTDEVVLKLAKDNDDHIDQVSVLKARLLDNFYMDFDRHEGQWEWSTRDTGKGKIYYAIPKDQDQAFFTNQGIIPYFVRKPWISPELQGFKAKASNIKTFNKPARNFDRFFLNELSRDVWERQIDTFLSRMTDDVIEKAMQQQPRETRAFDYDKIVNTLKERRNHFRNDMMEYYSFLSQQVNIVGSNQRELFVLDKQPGDKLHVTVHKIDKNNAIATSMYNRVFDGNETKELMIYGLEGNDSFVVKGVPNSIKVRMIGGSGDDHFVNESNEGKGVRVYDVTFEENKFSGNEAGFLKRINADPRNNEYNRLSYKYGYFNPGIQYGYNVDDGLFLGLKGEVVTQGFRKEPFATRHIFRAAHALRTSSYYFAYEGDFTRAVGNKDLLIRGNLRAPVNVTNFFGLGNNTVFDKSQPGGDRYYRARYNIGNLSFLLRRQLQSWMRINYGLAFQYFDINNSENDDKFLGQSVLSGVDNATLYKPKMYVGPAFLLDINSRNNPNLPTRGFLLDAGARSLIGLNGQSNRVTQLHWDMSVVASFEPRAIAVYALRLGVGHNIGAFEIPQAQYLSGTENLRGYRRNRFAGRTMLFNNAEIRIRLAEFSTFLFPGSLGILGFHDIGRVWQDGEENKGRWHNGYGGGIWIAPIKRWVVTGSLAFSKEEKALPYFSIGYRF
ncbi:MAG TPA: BamA/TamA family outer membrane protein [Flavisolibacter sp.]|nr:BamA/TamA family outer membrane protein [Flavisolibacter sp.]